ncbi:alginate export family protein [Longitalea arenae]|uniref:alginate export family protein n=1 Tax=Longitalea arenae TaxID=2812558 RepID=UPI001F07DA42|nr:alginate export family protein [Longitalea arenae]
MSKSANSYISYGGDLRYQYFYIQNEGWGEESEDNDGYILSRWLLHADLHASRHLRTFIQLQSSLANSRQAASAVDDNPLEVHQAFIDYQVNPGGKNYMIFRAGRQELLYGSQRLVSVREGPNNRQSFDGLRSIFHSGNFKADLFYSHYVAARKDIFDDGFNKDTRFWGVYWVQSNVPVLKNIDLYYLGLHKKTASFDAGSGKELRHSIGARVWNGKGATGYDLETVYQFGKFSGRSISAWTASMNISHRFNSIKWKPEAGLKMELISGDKHAADSSLQTFNPLFPRGAYFGLAALIGPYNLFDVHPSLSLQLLRRLNFEIDCDVLWRYSEGDGLYAVNGTLLYSGKQLAEKYIGKQLAAALVYNANAYFFVQAEFTWFDAGAYLQKAGTGNDILFAGVTAQLKF